MAEGLDNADLPIVDIITKTLDYGKVPIGEEKVLSIDIKNYGYISKKDVIIYSFTIAPDYEEFYMLDSATNDNPVSISPHNTKSFKVKFRPNSIREYSNVIYIKSNAYGAEPIILKGRGVDSNQTSVQYITEIESLSFQSIDGGSEITFSIVSESTLELGTLSIYSQEGKLIKSIEVSGNRSDVSVSISRSELPRLSLIRFTQGDRIYVHKYLKE